MDTAPITGLAELDGHLDELIRNPEIPLNAKLFDDVELQLTGEFPMSLNGISVCQLTRNLSAL